jgi:hypothetical protein
VLGAAKAVGALEPQDVEVHFIVAACEVGILINILLLLHFAYTFNIMFIYHLPML